MFDVYAELVGIQRALAEATIEYATVEERLRVALTVPLGPRSEGVDMSAESITHRLMELAEMSSLCLELGDIGRAAT